MELGLILYLVAMNIAGFTAMGVDKGRARTNAWRIPEKTLFFIAAIGGSIGSLAGMYVFRHKTKHLSFTIGMPAILVIHIAIAAAILYLGR